MSIPLTRLGGDAAAFNHSAGHDAEAEYDRLRDLARAEAQKRNDCFERSRQAYDSGDGAGAKALSNEGKAHGKRMEDYNRQASEYIFRENNAAGRVDDDTIDLHGQFVEEAEDILEARIRSARAQGQTHLHVIVGKGNHSANHVQKLKPRVEQVCEELGVRYETEENAGRIYVDLQGGSGGGAAPPPERPPHHDHGHEGEGHSGGHRPRPPHHRPHEEEDLLTKAVRKLGECCVIM